MHKDYNLQGAPVTCGGFWNEKYLRLTWEKFINTGRHIPFPWKFALIITLWIWLFACHHHILQSTALVAMLRCHNTLQHFFTNPLNTFQILRVKPPIWHLASKVAPKEVVRCSRNTRRHLSIENQLDRWATLIASLRHVQWCFEQILTQHKFPWKFSAQCFQKTRLSCHGRQLAHAVTWHSSAGLYLLRLRRKKCTRNTSCQLTT